MPTQRSILATVVGLVGAALLLLSTPTAADATRSASTSGEPARGAGHWAAAGELLVTRDHPVAALLRDGRVLVAGGTADRANSAEIYDPATGSSTATPPTHVVRFEPSMTRLADGRVLLAGGFGLAHGQAVRATEIYDPASGTWTVTAPMHQRRFGAAAALLHNGRVLVVGGEVYGRNGSRALRSAEMYLPRADRWVVTSPTRWPHASSEGRQDTAVLRDGDVLVAGQMNGDTGISGRAERYAVGSGRWLPAGTLPLARTPALIRLPSGQVLAVAGYTFGWSPYGRSPVDRYLPKRHRWVSDPALPSSFGYPGVVKVGGRPFAVGECPGRRPTRPCPAVARYRPGSRSWTPAAPMPDSRQSFATVRLPDGTVLVIAGTYQPPMTEFTPISSVLRWSVS